MDQFLKKFVAGFLSPTPFIAFLLLIGVILLWARRRSLAGPILVTLAMASLYLFGLDPVTEVFLHQTEKEYAPFKASDKKIKYVVVLAGGFNPSAGQPLASQLGHHTLTRLVEGIRIHREIPHSNLVVTGQGQKPEISESQAMKEMAVSLGVAAENIITESESKNTREHPLYLAKLLGKRPFVLVTSSLHMPRAMGAFKKAGLNPLAAPTAHVLVGDYEAMQISRPFVTSENLRAIDDWFMEFWGRLKYR